MKQFMAALEAITDEPLTETTRKTAHDLIFKEKLYEQAIAMCEKKEGLSDFQEEVKLNYADYLFKVVKNTKPAAYLYERCGAFHKALEAYKVKIVKFRKYAMLKRWCIAVEKQEFQKKRSRRM